MSEKHIHIISLDVPYPADYGGVVDLFYKLKYLHKNEVKIHLHCFVDKREPQADLEKYCVSVNYYKRKKITGISFSLPYIVSSRQNAELLLNLKKDNYHILFEGIHTTYYLIKNEFKDRKLFLRLHNVEFMYYAKLAKHEHNFLKRTYFKFESNLLKKYESKVANLAHVLTVSTEDLTIYQEVFAAKKISFLPVFLAQDNPKIKYGKGSYCLYHGNLSINENEEAAIWLMEEVFSTLEFPLVIAGKKPSTRLQTKARKYKNISIVDTPNDINMQLLIENAQLHVLPSFNNTGVKLKLLNALFNGRYCLVNEAGIAGSTLEGLCSVANDTNSFKENVTILFDKPFTEKEMQHRSTALKILYNNEANAQKFIALLY